MDTDSTWFAVLVIILSVFLALFLALSIVVVVKLIQIANRIKHIVQQAEQVADRAESISSFFERTATPVAILKLIANIGETIQKKAKKK
jgi:predicted PurR-regulated permease PerM